MTPETEQPPGPAIDSVRSSAEPAVDSPLKQPSSWLSRFWPALLLILLVTTGTLLLWQHVYVTDWIVLKEYHPANTIQTLASDDTMTSYAKRLFYVNRPQIDGKVNFNMHCSNGDDQVTVLGCYLGNRQGIYLYNVTDPRLAGIEQVTAAHEMLHQAYDRLSSSERTHVDALLVAYSKTITDPTLTQKIAQYQKIEPNSVIDEMHSVFGTEVANLPPALEQYYKQYFTGRSKVVQYRNQYEAAFTERQQQIANYDSQLATLTSQINTNKDTIATDESQLESEQGKMQAYRSNNEIDEYNALVPGFNDQVTAYKTLVSQTNTLITQYNNLVTARNAIAVQEQQLEQALDSQANTATAQ